MPITVKLPVRSSRRIKDSGASTSTDTTNSPDLSASNLKKKNWRDRLRDSHPEQFKEHLKIDAIKSSLYRLNLKGEKKQHYNEIAKLRMRKLRKKKKEAKCAAMTNGSTQKNKKKKHATRQVQKEMEEKREKERLRKRKQRAALSLEQRNEINRKRRERRQEEKLELLRLREQHRNMQRAQRLHKEQVEAEQQRLEAEERMLEESRIEQMMTAQRSKTAKRKSLSRALKALPRDAAAFTDTLIAIIDKAEKSPRKQKEMKERGLNMVNRKVNSVIARSIEDQLATIKKSKKKKDMKKKRSILQMMGILKKYRLQGLACRRFGVSPKTIQKQQINHPKFHKRKLCEATKTAVINCYIDSAIQLPDKKWISKKTFLKTGFLQEPISQVYNRFRNEHPNMTIGIKKFYELRPKHIKTARTIKYRGCLCEYCTNIELKADAINQVAHQQKKSSVFQGVYGVAKITMCPKQGRYNNRCCVKRKCKNCGTCKLKEYLNGIIATQGDKIMKWKRWDKVTSNHNGNTVSKQIISEREGLLTDCVAELAKECETITDHLFNANWQNQQFSYVTKNLPSDWIVLVFDFAENYTCKYQDEIQAAHWFHTNATVHPVVAYYACPKCNQTMQESVVMISADMTHDFHAVNKFMEIAVLHLKRKHKTIRRIIRFSDGCGAQYKSRGPFFDLSCAEQQYGVKVQYDFFGSRHGKGPSDGESAVIKRQASQAVLAGKAVINDARGLFEYCNAEVTKVPSVDECMHFQRVFYYVDNIDRDRGFQDITLHTVKGTRQIHNLRGVTVGQISARNLSCFCQSCVGNSEQTCDNAAYVDDWWTATVGDVLNSNRHTFNAEDTEYQADIAKNKEDNVKVGDYVAVIFDEKWFPGQVRQITGSSCNISFMWPKGNNRFLWPANVDEADIDMMAIFAKLVSAPEPVSSRYFSFDRQEIESVTRRVESYLRNILKVLYLSRS